MRALRTDDGKRLALLWLTVALIAQWFVTPAHALSQTTLAQSNLDRTAANADPIAAAVLSLCLPSQLGEEGDAESPRTQGGTDCQTCHAGGACLSAACAALCTIGTATLLPHKIQQDEQAVPLFLQHKPARAPPVSS